MKIGKKMTKLLFLDVDGTLTDGKIHISENGELFKSFNIKDGLAICDLLPKANILPVIITGRESAITENRCREVGITEIYQGVADKPSKLSQVADAHNCKLSECAYIGDDLNDYAAMQLCGFRACPMDAVPEIKKIADYVSSFGGGHGAVRDILEYMLRLENRYVDLLAYFQYDIRTFDNN